MVQDKIYVVAACNILWYHVANQIGYPLPCLAIQYLLSKTSNSSLNFSSDLKMIHTTLDLNE